ncbi:MAG: dienelactone hydrolase family protein [Roseiflexaceae bacterium]
MEQPSGFLALPSGNRGPVVLVLHAWWGLNGTIRAICERLAAAGFVAFAPDLYHGKLATTIAEAEVLARELEPNYQQAQAEIRQALAFLQQYRPNVAVIGFSLGAFYALDLANSAPEAIDRVVIYYGTGSDDVSQARAAYLGHFAENDPYEPREAVEHLRHSLQQAGLVAALHIYPGTGHWFAEPDRSDAYQHGAAELAWQRTLAFLQGHVL